MTTARLKTPVREVWQCRSSVPPFWVMECLEFHGDGMYLVRRSGKQIIHPGEWILRDLDGDPEWMTDGDFQQIYELVSTPGIRRD